MRSYDLFGFFLLFLLDFWRPTEALCSLENGTAARCHFLEDARYIDTYELQSLKASVAQKVLTSDAFENVTSLRYLDLSGGDLEEIHPRSFLLLTDLLSLNLADNHIKYLNSSSLEGLKNLQNLRLRRNSLQDISEAVLNLKSLKVLDISGNPLNCNCSTLKARDKLLEKGVKISKTALCSGPVSVKGWSLLKPSSKLICIFEEQDEGMQMDQPVVGAPEGSGEIGSGDEEPFEDDKEEDMEVVAAPAVNVPKAAETPAPETPAPETPAPKTTDAETPSPKTPEVEIPSLKTPEVEIPSPKTPEVEIPAPKTSKAHTPAPEIPLEAAQLSSKVEVSATPISPVEVSLEKSKLKGDDGLFFDTDEKPAIASPPVPHTEKPAVNDDLVYAVEGSGDDDEFEGSGTRVPPIDFSKAEDGTVFENTVAEGDGGSLFESLFGSWSDKSTTGAPEEKTVSDIENEEFLPVDSAKEPKVKVQLTKAGQQALIPIKSGFDLSDVTELNATKNGETKPEIANASSQETKMGYGSMVVLIILLAIFVGLVGLAAYKGDFCKKKRVPDDLERGTELKEMRKSLLDAGNAQPKISSNGNTESVPLMNSVPPQDAKDSKPLSRNGNGTVDGPVKSVPSEKSDPSAKSEPSAPESLDPVKPPRRSIPHEEFLRPTTNGKSNPDLYINSEKFSKMSLNLSSNDIKTHPNTSMIPADFESPPLSPDAQRVKIILQDNPDSVPKTPILITRTKMGENLVKTP
ncbi:protein windpipe-like [Belonocnema kinseyi]|uniref:protein windpipe-like n=1 Tax=Belonocnema kinseyi TaxID=2817044 RepID=UPI00143D7121|nr:protein windpipe-like [Belonocnema kinseyi]